MAHRYITIRLDEQEQVSFFLCLVIGTLFSIKTNALTARAGIWSLGRPNVREMLAEYPDIPEQLLRALTVADELDALQKVAPDHAQELLNQLLDELEQALRQAPNPIWSMELSRAEE